MEKKNRNINHSRSCGPQDSGISTSLKVKAAETPDYSLRGWINAFTLIELLVVVLIIGILAAVAVPQYQKAVEKSRATQAITLLRSVYEAAQRYQLANNEWPTSFDELDIQVPWTDTTKWTSSALDSRSSGEWTIDLVKDQYTRGVLVGRITGPYAGAGFAMWDYFYWKIVPRDTLLCVESRSSRAPNFGKTTGDYCKKLFAGTTLSQDIDSINQFSLP